MARMHRLRIEFLVGLKKTKTVEISPQLLREAVSYWVATGQNLHNVRVNAITWTRDSGPARTARGSDALEDVREKLLARVFPYADWRVSRGE